MCASPVQSGTATRLHCANGFSLSDKESKIPNLNACALWGGGGRKEEKRKRQKKKEKRKKIFLNTIEKA